MCGCDVMTARIPPSWCWPHWPLLRLGSAYSPSLAFLCVCVCVITFDHVNHCPAALLHSSHYCSYFWAENTAKIQGSNFWWRDTSQGLPGGRRWCCHASFFSLVFAFWCNLRFCKANWESQFCLYALWPKHGTCFVLMSP